MEEIQKGNRARFDQIKNQVEDSFEKGKEMPIGTISNGRKKIAKVNGCQLRKRRSLLK